MESLKPNEQRGKIAIAMTWIMLALYMLVGLSNYFQYRLLADVVNGEIVSDEALTANDARQQLLNIVMIVAYVASIITFILWFRRAYYNLHQRAEVLSYTEGWAAGAWFVPFVNLVRPYKIMQELYTETYALLGNKSGEFPKNYTTAYLGWWWTFWILNWFVDRIDSKIGQSAKTVDELSDSTLISLFSCAIGIPLALLAIKVISDYIQMERLFAAQDLQTHTPAQSDENQAGTQIIIPGPLL
jgi:uncharacterized membrane protein (DUF485 family)